MVYNIYIQHTIYITYKWMSSQRLHCVASNLMFKTWNCKIPLFNVWLFTFFNIWNSIFMFNFQFWSHFWKRLGLAHHATCQTKKGTNEEVAKTNAVATKAFCDPFVQFFTIMNLYFVFVFQKNDYLNIPRPPNSVSTACSASHSLGLRDLHVPGEENCNVPVFIEFSKKNPDNRTTQPS